MILWTSDQAEAATGGRSTKGWQASGVSIDSRTLNRGDLFIALKDVRDGHDFVAAAFEAGASAAVVSNIPARLDEDRPLLVVSDVQAALEGLGRAARHRLRGRVAAVTGSVGKTTTKEMLRCALNRQGKTIAADKSYNNHWGVPLTLARMPADTEFAIIEIGMNQTGEIAPLSELARPHVAMVTEIAPAHLAAFNSLEDIAREKADIFRGLEAGGSAILNAQSPGFKILKERAESAGAHIIRFGSDPASEFCLVNADIVQNGTVLCIKRDQEPQCVMLSAHGSHFARNALCALAAIDSLGADVNVAALDLRRWSPGQGRGGCFRIILDPEFPPIQIIDDAFNANPVSMKAAFDVLAARASPADPGKGRKIAVLGDMLELGRDAKALHAAMAEHPSFRHVAKLHCAGPLMLELHKAIPPDRRGRWYETAEELAADASRLAAPGDLVLVKGSKGSRISLVTEAFRTLGTVSGH